MSPDRVSNPGPLIFESGALPIALRGPAQMERSSYIRTHVVYTDRLTDVWRDMCQ